MDILSSNLILIFHLINVYSPCDNYSKTVVDNEFMNVTDQLECLFARNTDCCIFMVLNVDLTLPLLSVQMPRGMFPWRMKVK